MSDGSTDANSSGGDVASAPVVADVNPVEMALPAASATEVVAAPVAAQVESVPAPEPVAVPVVESSVPEVTQVEVAADPGEIAEASHGAGTPTAPQSSANSVANPVSAPAPAPAPVAEPPVVAQPAPVSSVRSILAKGLETIRFRKRVKLEKIVDLARKEGSIKNDDVEKLLHVSDSTAERYLRQLVLEGKLHRSGETTNIVYKPV